MDQLEPVAGAGESDAGGAAGRAGKADAGWKRQDEQKGQVPAERRLTGRADAGGKTRSSRYRMERPAELVREVPGGTARRAGKADAGWKRQGEQGR